ACQNPILNLRRFIVPPYRASSFHLPCTSCLLEKLGGGCRRVVRDNPEVAVRSGKPPSQRDRAKTRPRSPFASSFHLPRLSRDRLVGRLAQGGELCLGELKQRPDRLWLQSELLGDGPLVESLQVQAQRGCVGFRQAGERALLVHDPRLGARRRAVLSRRYSTFAREAGHTTQSVPSSSSGGSSARLVAPSFP